MSLFSMLGSASNTLQVIERALTVTQNNVANSSTPGYARQVATFEALPFGQGNGDLGGVASGPVQSTRDEYTEESVRSATSQLGSYQQQVNSLTPLQNYFDITGQSGIPAALSTLYSAFSTWASNPADGTAQQNVITDAQNVAQAFNTTASSIAKASSEADSQLSSLTDKVNSLVTQLSGYNAQIKAGNGSDPGLDASVNSTLESLSEVANISAIKQADGSYSVSLGSQMMLLSGTTQNKLSVSFSVPTTPTPSNPTGPPTATLRDSYGADVTSAVSSGQLAGILNVRNQVLPSIQGDGTQNGSLNQLAQGFADQVNTLIGFSLFTYNTSDATNTAASLKVSSSASIQNLPSTRVTALTGTAIASPITITTGTNDTLNLQVDGKPAPPIALSTTDTDVTSVAKTLNLQFSTLGIGAKASVTGNGSLVLSTTNTGNTGSIAILSGSANATLGLTKTTPTYQNGANSVALSLANLANTKEINGQSFTAYFGSIASNVGAALANAQAGQSAQQDVVTQTQTIRQQISGVDLNREATTLLQLQNSYQAASKMVTVIDSLTQTVLQLIQPS
jgi:flagellar hook-associated protein 1